MNIWKTLGYVVGGVGVGITTVVALPVAGPVGVVTAAGGLIASALGGIAGGVISANDNSEEDARKGGYSEGYKEGEQKAKAKMQKIIDELSQRMKKCEARFKEHKFFEETSIAMFAVAFSVANCDRNMHPEEIANINAFIAGEIYAGFPTSLKNEIEKMKNSPPNFNTTMEYVKKVDKEYWNIFDTIIDIVIYSDQNVHYEEKAYKNAWEKFKTNQNV